MTVTQMMAEIRGKLSLEGAVGMTDAQMIAVLNDGYKSIAAETLCGEYSQAITTVVGQRFYPFSGVKITKAVFEYDSISGDYPQYWFQWGNYLVIDPVPDAVYTVIIFTSVMPDDEMTEADNGYYSNIPYDIPEEFRDSVCDFGLAYSYLRFRKFKKFAETYNKYRKSLYYRQQIYMDRKAEKKTIKYIPERVVAGG